VCTLAVEKKNQGRFRYVGSDHSLVSLLTETSSSNVPGGFPVLVTTLYHCSHFGMVVYRRLRFTPKYSPSGIRATEPSWPLPTGTLRPLEPSLIFLAAVSGMVMVDTRFIQVTNATSAASSGFLYFYGETLH
jgi:hypothetical protein